MVGVRPRAPTSLWDAASITQEYIDKLKGHDMPDRMLHDIVQVASYFNYINRLADGLGVEVEGK